MRVALVTASTLPRPDPDLPLLAAEFRARGVEASVVVWDDPTARWEDFDLAIVRSTWDYLEKLARFEAWIDRAARATRLVNAASVLRWNIHKRYLLALADAGAPVVPTVLVEAGSDPDWDALFARFGELVLKPAVSAGSFGTVRVPTGDAGAARAHLARHRGRDFLVQPLLRSVVEVGESNLVCFGGRFSHAVRKGARWEGDAEQSRERIDPAADELAAAVAVFEALGSLGLGRPHYARIDLARGPEGAPLLMEAELLEPALFLDRAPAAAAGLVDAVLHGS
ncbi:MAG: hypothetical protein GC172_05205 [Phycisphaera sp.]|nr:hypothetical protein [Phycisphaera sp.]